MSIPIPGARQVFVYNHGRLQGGPIYYDRRFPQQAPFGPPPFNHSHQAGPWFQGISGGHHNYPQFQQNLHINISWNAPAPRNRNFGNHHFRRQNNNNSFHSRSRMIGGRSAPQPMVVDEEMKEACFLCGDYMQNSEQPGVHFCDAHHKDTSNKTQNNSIKSKLDSVLQKIQSALQNDYENMSEGLEKFFIEQVKEITTLHNEVASSRDDLTKVRLELATRAAEISDKEKKLNDLQSRLDSESSLLAAEKKKEKEEITRQWQQLRDEITRMEEVHNIQKGRIKLDVGGHVYTTSVLTLTRDPDSMLAAMFSGRHELKREEDGSVFIDRDGTHFRHILNYLRDGGLNIDSLPRSRQVLRELRNEAIYYQLHNLVQQIEKLF
ncbi:uncharacterized protein LOC121371763 [Gigantopelta aegis]|uniref:uncharacterized protein LOC121371763 n=1 Tax=Gigantopelta aegis TaxID=1735272 RepID=UPI001B889017|nr:uncharacterized protein LOC121371763 [Gigantopelta aegis]XP_041353828.1 uncharacterized protein LOC121371763 [Gigantopelta aegis]